jgi:thienamycin biosynthesis protein ThnN
MPLFAVGYSFGCALLPQAEWAALVLIAPTVSRHDYGRMQTANAPKLIIASEDDFATDAVTLRQWFEGLPEPKQLIQRRLDNHFFRGHESWLSEVIDGFLNERAALPPRPRKAGAEGMTLLPALPPALRGESGQECNALLRERFDLHFHPEWGSDYWLARQDKLGLNVRDRVRTIADLALLGPMSLDDLRKNSVRAFIPRTFHSQLHRFVIGETAGTSGEPRATAFRDDEFQAAFVEPFLQVVERTGFPMAEPWLWVGPSGPHVIGKAVRELARQTGSMDPFSVDFDPRWGKRLAEGSLARERYLDHVVAQALDILMREEIGVIFTTPPTLAALAVRMSDRQREAIHGVHYGGLSMTADQVNDFRMQFPNAVHLSGYGNTLFGVVMEVEDTPRSALDYFPCGHRVQYSIVAEESRRPCERGETGQVLVHRFDESYLLANVLERDVAERIAPSAAALALGWTADGLRDPRPPERNGVRLQLGIY